MSFGAEDPSGIAGGAQRDREGPRRQALLRLRYQDERRLHPCDQTCGVFDSSCQMDIMTSLAKEQLEAGKRLRLWSNQDNAQNCQPSAACLRVSRWVKRRILAVHPMRTDRECALHAVWANYLVPKLLSTDRGDRPNQSDTNRGAT
jgi:hypothetical protein